MSQCIRFTLGVAAAVCTAAGVSAQSAYLYQHDVSWGWPQDLGTTGTLTSTACADVTGDARPDLFVRGGEDPSSISFFSAVGTTAASQMLTPTCNDLCIAPKAGPDGLDALAFVYSGGLKRLDYSITDHVFTTPSWISQESEWQGARIVRSADTNWTGVADYVGVKGDHLIRYRRDTSPGVFTETNIEATSTIQDIQLVRWLGSGAHMAVAIRLSTGLEVRDLANGNSLGSFTNSTFAADAIAVVPSGGNLVDRVAVLLRVNGGTETLRTYKRTSPSPEVNLTITDAPGIGASLAVADMDGDKDYDLVATWKTDQSVHVFENSAGVGTPPGAGAAPVFAMGDWHAVIGWDESDGDIATNEAQVVFKNTDTDGQADILSPVRRQSGSETFGELAVLKRQIFNDIGCQFLPDPNAIVDANGDLFITGLFGKPVDVTGLPTSDRYFEVLVWTQDADPAALTTPTDEEASAYLHYPISIAYPPFEFFDEGLPESYPPLRFSHIPLDAGCIGDVVRFVEVREVIWENDRTYLAGPTFTIAATSNGDMNDLFGESGCPDAMSLANCSPGTDGPVARHRTRRPPPAPGNPVVIPPLSTLIGCLGFPEEQ